MAESPRKRCAVSLSIRDLLIKTTMRHHLTPIEWLSSINQHTAGAGEDGRKGPSCTAGGNADGAAAVESSMRFLKTLEILLWVSGHHTATRGNMARRAGALVHMDQSAGLGTPPASAWPQEGPQGWGRGCMLGTEVPRHLEGQQV